MAVLAVRVDRAAIFGRQAAVVAAKTARRRHVTDVVRVGAERDLHDGKDIAPVEWGPAPDPEGSRRFLGGMACRLLNIRKQAWVVLPRPADPVEHEGDLARYEQSYENLVLVLHW